MIPSTFVMPEDNKLKKVLLSSAKKIINSKSCEGFGCYSCPCSFFFNNKENCLKSWGSIYSKETQKMLQELIDKYTIEQLEFDF